MQHTTCTQHANTQHRDRNTRYNNNMQHTEDNREQNTEQHTDNNTEHNAQPQRTEHSTEHSYISVTYRLHIVLIFMMNIYISKNSIIQLYTNFIHFARLIDEVSK